MNPRAAVTAVAGLALLAPLVGVGQASATYPGSANGRLAYGKPPAPGAATDIYSVLPNGRAERRLTNHPGADVCPSYSADGKKIAFCSDRTGTFQIWVMKANGKKERQVTRLGAGALWPDFSPDGSRIVFQSLDDGDIYEVDRSSGELTRLTHDQAFDGYPVYSPDGSRIAFISERTGVLQVWVMDADGSHERQLTFDDAPKDLPDWSPDGERIAFQSAATGDGDIYVMDADGGGVEQVTTGATMEMGPVWSPDGTQIAFLRFTEDFSSRSLFVVGADGDDEHLVTEGARVPAWQPRGHRG